MVWSGLSGGVTDFLERVAILWLAMGQVMHLLIISGWATASAQTLWSLAVRIPLIERCPSLLWRRLMLILEGLVERIRHAVDTSLGGGKVRVVPVGNCRRTPWTLKVILLPWMVENCVTEKRCLSKSWTMRTLCRCKSYLMPRSWVKWIVASPWWVQLV